MNWKYFLLVTGLLLATAIPISYKTFILGMDFFPSVKKDTWAIEFMAKVKGSPKSQKIVFPIPKASDRIQILETQFEGQNLALAIKTTLAGAHASLTGISRQNIKVFYRVNLKGFQKKYKMPVSNEWQSYPKKVAAFLDPPPLSPSVEQAIERLEYELFSVKMTRLNRIKTLFYFLHEEILKGKKHQGIEQALLKSKGSSRDKAELFTILARRQGIPARTIMGITLTEKENIKRTAWHWNEVYLGQQWIPVLLKEGYLGEIPAEYLPLATSTKLRPKWPNDGFHLTVNAERLSSEQFNALEYRKQLTAKKSLILSFSPYTLPLSEQPAFKLLLLFAFGTLVLAFCRNIIGMKSFGIFFPVLLALFFKDTSLWFGMGFFGFIIIMGTLERRLLTAMHLLAVPRFSIILVLLVITLLLFAILNNQYQFSQYNPAILPIIITTMFIERFSIKWEEEGTLNTGQALLGTFFISIVAYSLFSWELLERLLYTHPETLFTIIAFLIMIGRYTGYRVSEIIRFREFLRQRA